MLVSVLTEVLREPIGLSLLDTFSNTDGGDRSVTPIPDREH